MLAMSDINIEQFFPVFAHLGIPVAFLVPTPTGYEKSIMDAIGTVRVLLRDGGIHDYSRQLQGPENKVMIESYFVGNSSLFQSEASLYRPITKNGDPRIWFRNLKQYCNPYNLLALTIYNKCIYVFNLSNHLIYESLFCNGFVFDVLNRIKVSYESNSAELLNKIYAVHNMGFIPSITHGDPGVGDTLENALGIVRNNSRQPDYNGIELKASRTTRNGERRTETRSTLFTRVPDMGMTYRQIVDTYGKWQIPRNHTTQRFQLYETFKVSRPNAYGLQLEVDINNDKLDIVSQNERMRKYVSSWLMVNLREALLLKHHETFWVKAEAIMRDGIEYFRYDKVLHTKNPNTSLLIPLLDADKITVDLAAHYKPDGKWRDHGILFKMKPEDIPLLLGTPIEYTFT